MACVCCVHRTTDLPGAVPQYSTDTLIDKLIHFAVNSGASDPRAALHSHALLVWLMVLWHGTGILKG